MGLMGDGKAGINGKYGLSMNRCGEEGPHGFCRAAKTLVSCSEEGPHGVYPHGAMMRTQRSLCIPVEITRLTVAINPRFDNITTRSNRYKF